MKIIDFCLIIFCFTVVFSARAGGVVLNQSQTIDIGQSYNNFESVGYLSSAGGSTGVLISPYHVVTAGHAAGLNATFTVTTENGNITASVKSVTKHPNADLAIISLATPIFGVEYYDLNDNSTELGNQCIIVGYGVGGIGIPDSINYPKGVKRAGQNTIDSTVLSYLFYDFDQLATQEPEITVEGMIADGDSGGATFIVENGKLVLTGIHLGIFGGGEVSPQYGDRGYDIRISKYDDWIESIIYGADINKDGDIDTEDLFLFSNDWLIGENEEYPIYNRYNLRADLNQDGYVNFIDFSIFAKEWKK